MSDGRDALERALGYGFGDGALLETALSHSSWANENDGGRGNERLEFLGDAVLGLVIADLLFEAHPDWDEGDLTKARAAMVNRKALAERARSLDIGPHVRLGRTELATGAQKDRILANCFEAVVGAVFLDGGLEPVVALCRRLYGSEVERGPVRDAKTAFQEWAHATHGETPNYRTVADSGTENDESRFTVRVAVASRVMGEGVGRSKRNAEQAAASAAMANVESES